MKKALCILVIMLLIFPSIPTLLPVKAAPSSEIIEVEINQFRILRDLDGFMAPHPDGIGEPYFRINVLGVDDDNDATTSSDNDWYSSLFNYAKLLHLTPSDLGSPFLGPIYVPKQQVTLPFTVVIQAYDWDSALPGMSDQLIVDRTLQITTLPSNQIVSNDDIEINLSIRRISDTVYDKSYLSEFGDSMIGQQWSLFDLKANYVNHYFSGKFVNTIVAVIDSGVNYNYPDLQNSIWKNPVEIKNNGIDDDGNGYVDDWNGFDFVEGHKTNSLWVSGYQWSNG